jgi:hypothetical protein
LEILVELLINYWPATIGLWLLACDYWPVNWCRRPYYTNVLHIVFFNQVLKY